MGKRNPKTSKTGKGLAKRGKAAKSSENSTETDIFCLTWILIIATKVSKVNKL